MVTSTPRPVYPRELYRRLGGLQGKSGRARKISLPPGFDPRTWYRLRMRIISQLCIFRGIVLKPNGPATLDPISLRLMCTILELRMVFRTYWICTSRYSKRTQSISNHLYTNHLYANHLYTNHLYTNHLYTNHLYANHLYTSAHFTYYLSF